MNRVGSIILNILLTLYSTIAITANSPVLSSANENSYFYSPVGKRDPFESFSLQMLKEEKKGKPNLEKFDLGQLKLVGILLKNKEQPRAMFEAPDGESHIVKTGTRIGRNNGFVRSIMKNKVLIEERYANLLGKIIPQVTEMELVDK